MYKILLLTDFSTASRHALAFSQALFADTAADFCLLHAYPIETAMAPGAAFLLADEIRVAEENLQRFRQEAVRSPEPPYHTYRTVVAPGGPVGVVEVLMRQEHFDLVVVGATGTGQSEWLGSVATGVVRQATTNVLVVPVSAPIRPLQRIVLATDYRSVNDAESFAFLKELASRKLANVTLLTITNGETEETPVSVVSEQYVLRALSDLPVDQYVIHDDDVVQGIQAYIDTHTVDLLVTLPHHRSLFDALAGRSVSRSIAYRPRVPLLTLYDGPVDTAARIQPTDDANKMPFASYL
ncbi:universal stress protein [Fibrisoma limi]|nr:universal stress protein [Fibrisoma limi]